MIPPRLPARYLPSKRTPDFKIILATEPSHDSAVEAAIQHYRDGMLVETRAPVVCCLCAVVTFGFAPGQRRPAGFCVITHEDVLEVRGICGGCEHKDEWLAGRVTDQLAKESRAARGAHAGKKGVQPTGD